MSTHQTWASEDASRLSTRRGEWLRQMTNAALYELEMDLAGIPTTFTFSERAVLAASFVDAAAGRLTALGVTS